MNGHVSTETLSAYLDGELEAAEAAPLGAHLDGCAECAARLDSLQSTAATLRQLERPLPPAAVGERLRLQLAAERQRKARPAWWDALLPWRSIRSNIALPLELHGVGAAARRSRVDELLALVGLGDFADSYPDQLSGGMQQRVAIARALAESPRLLLMDEPFGALDALTRAKLQDELLAIVQKTHSTVVMVTHDVDEAVLLSDKIVMMTNGPAATIGEVLHVDLPRPRNRVELAEDRDYVHYRKAVIDFLYTRQAHVEKQAA